jgi:hypothetical protein
MFFFDFMMFLAFAPLLSPLLTMWVPIRKTLKLRRYLELGHSLWWDALDP